jgi:hypothetical protein
MIWNIFINAKYIFLIDDCFLKPLFYVVEITSKEDVRFLSFLKPNLQCDKWLYILIVEFQNKRIILEKFLFLNI